MTERPTRRKALCILIEAAARDAAGTGTGVREALTWERQVRVAQAVVRLYREAFDQEPDNGTLRNLGLPSIIEEL